MKKLNLIILITCLILTDLVKAQTTFPLNGVAEPQNSCFAFTNATLVINPTTTIKNGVLLIEKGIIVAAAQKAAIPKHAKIINLNGAYVYPSFIDLYSNYGIQWQNTNKQKPSNQQFVTAKKGAYSWNEALRPELTAADYFAPNAKQTEEILSSGFGSTLTQIQDGIIRGNASLVLVGNLSEHDLILNQKNAAAFSFNKGSSTQDYPGSAMGAVALIRQTYLDGDWYKNQTNEYNASLKAFNELKTLPVIFEAENKYAVLRAARIAKEFNGNYIIKGNGDEYQRINEIKQTQLPLIVPVNFPKPYEVSDPFDAAYVSTADLKHWELAPFNTSLLEKNKVNFTITMQGSSPSEFLKNLRKAVNYGLSETEALKALTERPANLIKNSNLGQLKKGMIANFFISDTNIFHHNANIYEHWIKGKQHIIQARNNNLLTGKFAYKNYQLIITGSPGKYSAELHEKDTFKATLSENYGMFSANFKNGNTMLQLSIWVSKSDSAAYPYKVNELSGYLTTNNGKQESVLFSWVEPIKSKHNNHKKDSFTLPDIIYPFTDFGSTQTPVEETIIFKNATVWTNEKEGILKETDVLIENGKIAAIGKNLSSKNARIIDASGMHLTNGIIDEHSHIGIYRGVNECTQAVTAEVRIGDVINADDINIYRQLAGGVIACQQLHGSCNPIGGQSSIIKLRWGLAPEQLKIASADGFIKFALGENVKQSNWGNETMRYPQTRMGVEQIITDAFNRAREYEAKLKANPKLTRKDLELEAVLEILNKKRFISCHSYVQSEINMLMHVADRFNFKVNTFTHILEGYKVADKMKAHGVNASTFADWWAYKYEVVDAIPQNGVLLTKMGVNTAINSDDAEMGRRLNQEAAKMIKYGNLTEEEAWKMVTLNPAKMLHLDAETGSIKKGKSADLVLWNNNPLSIYAKPMYTLVDGIVYFSLERDKALQLYNETERQRIIKKMIEAKLKGEKTEHKISAPDPDYHCDDEGW